VPLGRCLPVVRSFVSVVAGFVEVPVALFAVLSLIGTAVWVTVISLVGYGVGNAWNRVNHDISLAGYGIAAIAVVCIAAFIVIRLRELRKEEHAEADEARGHQPKHRSPTS
jgi:membrane protein DedA with SNARE-associated domain